MGVVASGAVSPVATVMITGPQYRKLIKEYDKTGSASASASKAGMDRKTASKRIHGGEGPRGGKGSLDRNTEIFSAIA